MTATIQEFDLSVNLLQAILWQYTDAKNLQSLLTKKQDWYDENQTEFWDNWFTNVFDLRTADDFGCSVWSIILDLPLTIKIPTDTVDAGSFGFGEFRNNFFGSNFSTPSGNSFIQLSLEQKRTVLRMRYFQLTSKGTVPEINHALKEVFGDGVYVLDGLNMTGEIIFQTEPSSETKFILEYYDVIPRPAAVGLTYTVLTKDAWGFGPDRVNFEHGNFKG